jgi:hypothetical protein
VQRLIQMARMGDLQGLMDTLEGDGAERIELQADQPAWLRLVDDMDFDGLLMALRRHPLAASPHHPEAEEESDDVPHG